MKRWLLGWVLVCVAQVASAGILWNWEIRNGASVLEAGQLTTTGTYAGTAAPGNYTIHTFSVTQSTVPGNVGASYSLGSQLPERFDWDGTVAGVFYRQSFSNGANFYRGDNLYRYVFYYGLTTARGDLLNAVTEAQLLSNELVLTPVGSAADPLPQAVPGLGAWALALLGVLLASVALVRRGVSR